MTRTVKKRFITAVCALVVATVGGTQAMGQDGGGPSIYTGLGPGYAGHLQLGVGWSDNPYVKSDGTVETDSALMFRLTPVVGIDFPINEFIYLGAEANLRTIFVVPTDSTEGTTSFQPILRGLANFNASEYTSLSFRDEYLRGNLSDELDGEDFENNLFTAIFEQEFLLAGIVTGVRFYYENERFEEDSDSVFFDYTDNKAGIGLKQYILPTDAGRYVTIDVSAETGERQFNDGDFTDQPTTRENPKNHDYYGGKLAIAVPFSTLLTVNGSVGWDTREYDDTTAGRDEKSENANWLLSALLIPGGPVRIALSASQHTTDTFVYQRSDAERFAFETLDGLFNNVDENYREVEVTRLAANINFDASDRVTLGAQVGYQQSEAEASDHLAAVGGSSGTPTRGLNEERITLGATAEYDISERVSLGGRYQYGMSEDGPQGDYDYNEVTALLKYKL